MLQFVIVFGKVFGDFLSALAVWVHDVIRELRLVCSCIVAQTSQRYANVAILLFPLHPVAEYIAADLEGFRWSSPIRASTLWTSSESEHHFFFENVNKPVCFSPVVLSQALPHPRHLLRANPLASDVSASPRLDCQPVVEHISCISTCSCCASVGIIVYHTSKT